MNIKTFIIRSVLAAVSFVVLCVAVSSAIYAVIGDRSITEIETPFLIDRENIVRADSSINTLFVGSSIMFRQINPDEFDAAATELKLRSYNLGTPGLYPMRSVSYLEHLVANPPPDIDYIVFELFRLDTVTYNYKAPEIMRLMTWGGFYDLLQTITAANFPRDYKRSLAGEYLRAFGFKIMGFGMLDYLQTDRFIRARDQERIDNSVRGFLAKDVEIATSREQENIDHIKDVGAVLLESPELLGPREQLHRDKYQQIWQLRPSPYTRTLLKLIADAEARGIKLVYMLPPLMTQRGIYFAYPAWLQMPVENRLDMSDPDRFPEIYQIDNVFDLEHVNSEGAVYLSRYLAEALVELERN